MNVAIIGMGLMGGSLALDLRGRGFAERIIGVERSEENAREALRLGLVQAIEDRGTAVAQADLIVLAVPVDILLKELPQVLDTMRGDAVVTDMGSTKRRIAEAVKDHPMRHRFVAAHPMAGTEHSGPGAAVRGLFQGKVCIICDGERSDADAVERVEGMFRAIGMDIKHMGAVPHDMHAAYVSHVSHISSFVLAATVLEKEKDEEAILEMAGGGFESTVRLAKSSPAMWAPIFEQNRENILEVMDCYMEQMYRVRNLINKGKFGELGKFMEEANRIGKILE